MGIAYNGQEWKSPSLCLIRSVYICGQSAKYSCSSHCPQRRWVFEKRRILRTPLLGKSQASDDIVGAVAELLDNYLLPVAAGHIVTLSDKRDSRRVNLIFGADYCSQVMQAGVLWFGGSNLITFISQRQISDLHLLLCSDSLDF